MKFLWCDTETTGLDPQNAAPFEIGLIFVNQGNTVKIEKERTFYLNALAIPGIEYNEEAAKIHGYSRETIESFDDPKDVMQDLKDFLYECLRNPAESKMFFCGYNCQFDYKHMKALFERYYPSFDLYFYPQLLDVFEQVKMAGKLRKLPYLENRKLTTVAKFLNIDLTNAHDAMGDIRATKEVSKSLSEMGVLLK